MNEDDVLIIYLQKMAHEGYAYEPLRIRKHSVEELRVFMPKAFNGNLSLEVAFKEGYNLAIDIIKKGYE